ncbi:hypothetical protein AGOR_G00060680 [Albula goreensis]|uniref:Fanconi anemia group B protein n=1 Tax=Albula goreensis TaxID=1534307 RepID=A0A8T3DSN2_9TELE|nr:hypothetical protein AGOR_G00060680 [Albula goreensis]
MTDASSLGAMLSHRGQSMKLLSNNGDVLSFQFTHSLASGDQNQKGSELRWTRMSFQWETKAFSIKTEGTTVINKSSSTSVDIVDCASVVDVSIGLTVPCLLLKQCKKKGAYFKYILLTLSYSNSLNAHLEFKLPFEIKDNLTFLQGPSVLWSHMGIVYYTSLRVGEVKQVPLQLSSVNFIGELPLDRRKIIILGSQASSQERPNDRQEDFWSHKSTGYFLEDGEAFDGACVFPHAYSSVVKCAYLVWAEEDNDGLNCSVVAATSKKQLVWFEGGVPKDVCVLPFEEPQEVQIIDTGRNSCLFAVSFSHGNMCTVWKDSFQVASCWQGMYSYLVDDFVGCGTDQALIMFDNHFPPGATMSNFIITDLGDITYSSRPESHEKLDVADTVQENYLLTVQALESRLQNGMSSIQDLQRDLEEKERVILQSVRALTDLISGREHTLSSAQQEGLVSLWDEDEAEEGLDEEKSAMPEAPATYPTTLVEKVWHRVIEDHMVVGVQLTSDAASSLENASVSLLLEPDQGPTLPVMQTCSRSFRFPQPLPPTHTSPTYPEPLAKRKRPEQSSEAGSCQALCPTVTGVTELAPLLAFAGRRCYVLLHSVQNQGSAAPLKARGPVVTQCGFVSLDIQDVALGKHTPQLLNNHMLTSAEAREDLLSLLAVSDSRCFQISRSDHTLFDVPQWLLGALQCERAAVWPDFLLSSMGQTSTVMLFHWQERSPFEGELLVYYRGQHRLLQFLDSLCRYLLPSHRIRPLSRRTGQDPAQVLASSLEREALALREGLTSLLCSTADGEELERTGQAMEATEHAPSGSIPTGTAPTDPKDELQRYRAEWERERERSRRTLCPLVEVERYRKLTDTLSHVQMQTDIAAYALSEALPLPSAPSPHASIPSAPNS